MSEQNEAVNAPEPVDPKKSTRNKIGVGIFLLLTLIGAMAFVYFAATLVKKPLGTSRGAEEAPEVQDEVRYRGNRTEGEFAGHFVAWPENFRTSSTPSKIC